MSYLLLLGIALLLLAGFVILIEYEKRRGVRLFALHRAKLDDQVLRAGYIYTHVDLLAFGREELQAILNRLSHAIAHFTLRAVRLVERVLTRVVRHLRTTAVETEAPRETAREFVRTLSDFKETLETNHPEVQSLEEEKRTPQS